MHNIFSNKKVLRIFLVWWIIWSAIHFSINQFYINNIYDGFIDVLLSTITLCVFSYAISLSLKYYKPSSGGWINLMVWILTFTIIWHFTNLSLVKYFCNDLDYINYISNSTIIRFVFGTLIFTCFVLLNLIWNYLFEKQEEEYRKNKIDQIAREAELNNLRQQLQPHFLFNSLNSINALTLSNPEDARNMISRLSEFLRGTLRKEQSKLISLKEELTHISLYLEIEKVRFGYRLNTNIDCDQEIENLKLPPLILQPAIENAIKYGLYDTIDPITINVICLKENNYLKIEITNPFDPLISSKIHGTGFGLKSISRRLSLIFNRSDLLRIIKNENIFTTQLIIPQTND